MKLFKRTETTEQALQRSQQALQDFTTQATQQWQAQRMAGLDTAQRHGRR